MSSHGWSGEGLGEEAGEGLGGWAPPLETETPPPAEIRVDEDEEHAGGSVEGDARGRTPTGGGSNEGLERGTPRRTEPRVEGRKARRDGEGTLGAEPLSPRARRLAESVLDTPRGREKFNQFLARLARQPAPSEEPILARTTAGETAHAAMSTPRARQGDAFSFDASRPSLPPVSETQGDVPTVMPAAAQRIGTQPRRNEPIVGIQTELRNAVKVIVPFYSDTATSKRAAAFWRFFEQCTHGMDGQMRLTAFEQCLNGKIGQEWWYDSRIDSFEALTLWSRLKAAKRKRGESVEEWGDRIFTMCEALNYHEPRMRYEFFLDGLRIKQMKAVLNTSMVTSIPEACALLLYKNLHLPVEEEDEFAGEVTGQPRANGADSTETQVLQELRQMNQLM
ncbi:hypothetical protein F442_17878 [Phytophthora nicotianae P10297]|uniref:Uncharacterized protein n=1 Tax=Phytophthora nicotianae P10297 TaxID=1317064 RepID=W2YG47_PHYNI|nr:hypothetical protein F442_17878 [Phytophthora nicotianae P10297]